MIEYEIVPNPLTTPPSYSLRVRPRGTVGGEDLFAEVAQEVALDPATVAAVLDGVRRVTARHLLDGDTVQVPGIGLLSAQIAEKLLTPTQPLSDAATRGVNFRTDSGLLDTLKNEGHFTRVESASQAPKLVTLTALGGATLEALRAGNLVQIEGERLALDPAQPDEGAFLLPATGPAVRMTDYNAKGQKTTQFFVAAGLTADTDYTLELRTRRSPGGPIYATRWPAPLHTADDAPGVGTRARKDKA